ncbi:MAG: HDOD domain-containing protein [Acidobacteria bacterium]|nr:HDOD domain-containing protein [Acidobacteriota bacterium]
MKKQILFVDDEPRVLDGLKRMLRSMRAEWEMTFVESGEEALGILSVRKMDVVVTDMRMPGMNGAELLTVVKEKYPHVVRIVLSGHADEDMIKKSVGPAHQYISKPSNADELKAAVRRACSLMDILADESLKRLVSRIENIPSLPSMYTELLDAIQKQDCSIREVGNIVAKDMGMTAKLLQLVNSSFFGRSRQVSNPSDAAVLLGLDIVKSLVLAFGLFRKFDPAKVPPGFIEGVYEHSMETARLAKILADFEGMDKETSDCIFMVCVLHDIGKLVLADNLPEDYREVLALSESGKLSVHEAEIRTFGTSHSQVGAYLMGLWGLPENLVETLAFHHVPGDCPVDGLEPLGIVHAANAIEHFLKNTKSNGESAARPDMDFDFYERLGLSDRVAGWIRACTLKEDAP